MKTILLDRQQSLVQWVSQATGISTLGVKLRLRGNDLHILCEGTECPQRWRTLSDLLQALQQTDLDLLTSSEQPSIYQVFVYGRKKGDQRPQWCHRVHLNQLEKHLDQVKQSLVILDAEKSKQLGGALIISNESLARQGNPDAIARYLSETLSTLGVAVNVKIKQLEVDSPRANNRLWIFCRSSYSPDISLLAEPVAQKLRHLRLAGYQDAVIVSHVSGETSPDWLLRVDLTPPEIMLKEWARWGDVQAISRLLTEGLSELKVAVQATLKESTLHIFCTPAFDPLESASAPDQTLCMRRIAPQLETLAPQGILAATIYGQRTTNKQPSWIDWLSLNASVHTALATSTLDLATAGDQPAITFLLERLLNPDLDWRLKTGGIRVLLRQKNDLLHIVCDAPVCPSRQQVATKVTQFIRQLQIPSIAGVRVYGRSSGNKEPVWNYGLDFVQRQRLVPEATPEFAATAEYVNTLVNSETNEPIIRPDLTGQKFQSFVGSVSQNWVTTISTTTKNLLLASQLFTNSQHPVESNSDNQGLWVALVWSVFGLMLTLQTDWMLGHLIVYSKPTPAKSLSTQSGPLTAAPLKEKATSTAILLAARSSLPTLNARQLDEQLALYKQRLAAKGKPPDVLIVGSSRALRGIDPDALSQALATQGHPHINVFNFGINGATAQVVNFILCQLLEPSELPKIVIWADGSRAFNNSRKDVTFDAIAASKGYKQVLQTQTAVTKPVTTQINGYESLNQWLNQSLADISNSYQHRDQIKTVFQKPLKYLPFSNYTQNSPSQAKPTDDPEEDSSRQAIDIDGFLPLSIRFNPASYYQQHPRVPGSFDNDYTNFHLGGEQEMALQKVIKFTHAHKIFLVLVNMPLTADYLDPVRRNYEQEFQQYMSSLSTNPDLNYLDFSQLWLTQNDYFSDPSHLNRYGAYEISYKLAKDPMIPWPVK